MKTNSDFKRHLDRSPNFRALNDDKNYVSTLIVLLRWLFPQSNEEKIQLHTVHEMKNNIYIS